MSGGLLGVVLAGCSVVVSYDGGGADTGSTVASDSTTDTDTETGTGVDPGRSIVGVGAGDGIGAGGLWLAPDFDGNGSAELLVGAPSLGVIGLFDGGAIGDHTSFDDARLRIVEEGAGRAVAIVAGPIPLLAVGSEDEDAVWILSPSALSGTVEAEDVAVGQIEAGDEGEEVEGLGTSIGTGDFDGDGRIDLAIGSPNEQGGQGRAYVVGGAEGYTTGTVDLDDGRVEVRGVVGGLGTTLVLGALDDSGYDGLLVCAPGEGAGGVCHRVPGPAAVDDRDVNEVSVATVSGTAADPLGVQPPVIDDVDGDGRPDLLLISTSGVLYGFLGELPAGAQDPVDADLIVAGGVGAVAGDGAVLVGAPDVDGVGVVFGLPAVGSFGIPADGDEVWRGSEAGGSFGAVTSDVGSLVGPTDIAVGSPSGAGRVTIFAR